MKRSPTATLPPATKTETNTLGAGITEIGPISGIGITDDRAWLATRSPWSQDLWRDRTIRKAPEGELRTLMLNGSLDGLTMALFGFRKATTGY